MLRASKMETTYRKIIARPAAKLCMRLGLSANHISMGGLLAAGAAGAAFVFSPLWGGVLTLFSGMLDTLDGELSRLKGENGKEGGFLDSVLDRYAEFLFVVGIWIHFQVAGRFSVLASLLCLVAVCGSLMVSYTHSRGLNFGISCSAGFFERPERVAVLGAGGVLEGLIGSSGLLVGSPIPVLVVVLALLAAGTHWTAIQRILYFLQQAHNIREDM